MSGIHGLSAAINAFDCGILKAPYCIASINHAFSAHIWTPPSSVGSSDELFQAESQRFFDLARNGQFQIVTSGLVTVEVSRAPQAVQHWYDEWLPNMEIISVHDSEALRLAEAYLDAAVVTPKWRDDALHVAYATIAGCHLIVSWNFKHIVHYQKAPQYNAVNVLYGYAPIAIHSPLEIVDHEEENV